MFGLHMSASGFEAVIDGTNEYLMAPMRYMQAMQDLQAQLKRVRLDAQHCPDIMDLLSQITDA